MRKRGIKAALGGLLMMSMLFPAGCTRPPETPPEPPVAKIPPAPKPRTGRPYEVFGKIYYPMTEEEAVGYVDEGIASWYGKEFHNRPTATGERYDMFAISAAHTILPIPMMARVTNLENGLTLDVRVNDRGPFVDNRLIDLSYGAAIKLGYAQKGITRVRVEALTSPEMVAMVKAHPIERYTSAPEKGKGKGKEKELFEHVPLKSAPWRDAATSAQALEKAGKGAGAVEEHFIQVGSFGQYENARAISQRIKGVGAAKVTKSSVGARTMYRVRLGPYATVEKADEVVRALRRLNVDEAQIIRD